jgi:hypothetical protein
VRLRITARAARQVREADAWWREHRADARGFIDEFSHAIDLLTELPDLGAVYLPKAAFGVRRLLLAKSEHYLYYLRDRERHTLRILALWSCYRGRMPPLGLRKRRA